MNPLNSITGTIVAGVVLALILVLVTMGEHMVGPIAINSIMIWLHVLAGITWIGLLYYFNFVQVPAIAHAAKDDGGPGGAGITKYVAPRALLWFRWGAVVTWLSGAAFLLHRGQLDDAFALGMLTETVDPYALTIGMGAWLGTIMLFNVWVLIWPNQKKILGLTATAASPEEIAKAKKVALMASRTNTLLSIPMILAMTAQGHGLPF
jgi:uncharacterized membrane protein